MTVTASGQQKHSASREHLANGGSASVVEADYEPVDEGGGGLSTTGTSKTR